MEHLNTYITANGLKAKWLAAQLGMDQSRLSRIRKGRTQPDLSEALKIAAFTQGAVPVEAWQ